MNALVTGATGQDGSYLVQYLLSLGYNVWGMMRRSSSFNTERIDSVFDNLNLHMYYDDMTSLEATRHLMDTIGFSEIYNLAAQSHVQVSFQEPEYTFNVNASGFLRLLEAVRCSKKNKGASIYQASSSEMFGSSEAPQKERTPFKPCSPYGISKLAAYWTGVKYRESYNMRISNGILFNHESERRGKTFVSRKITCAVARIKAGLQKELYLGNLDAIRDWGHAEDYVKAMHLILQYCIADDFVIGTGESHTVREFVALAFDCVGLDWNDYVRIDMKYFRPNEVHVLQADASKAHELLNWTPSVKFADLVKRMVDNDIKELENGR